MTSKNERAFEKSLKLRQAELGVAESFKGIINRHNERTKEFTLNQQLVADAKATYPEEYVALFEAEKTQLLRMLGHEGIASERAGISVAKKLMNPENKL